MSFREVLFPEELLGSTGTGPLSGLVVADFTRVLAGRYCTMLLADMGATVIKVEGPGGDHTRARMPPVRDGESTYYMSFNRMDPVVSVGHGADAVPGIRHPIAFPRTPVGYELSPLRSMATVAPSSPG